MATHLNFLLNNVNEATQNFTVTETARVVARNKVTCISEAIDALTETKAKLTTVMDPALIEEVLQKAIADVKALLSTHTEILDEKKENAAMAELKLEMTKSTLAVAVNNANKTRFAEPEIRIVEATVPFFFVSYDDAAFLPSKLSRKDDEDDV